MRDAFKPLVNWRFKHLDTPPTSMVTRRMQQLDAPGSMARMGPIFLTEPWKPVHSLSSRKADSSGVSSSLMRPETTLVRSLRHCLSGGGGGVRSRDFAYLMASRWCTTWARVGIASPERCNRSAAGVWRTRSRRPRRFWCSHSSWAASRLPTPWKTDDRMSLAASQLPVSGLIDHGSVPLRRDNWPTWDVRSGRGRWCVPATTSRRCWCSPPWGSGTCSWFRCWTWWLCAPEAWSRPLYATSPSGDLWPHKLWPASEDPLSTIESAA